MIVVHVSEKVKIQHLLPPPVGKAPPYSLQRTKTEPLQPERGDDHDRDPDCQNNDRLEFSLYAAIQTRSMSIKEKSTE